MAASSWTLLFATWVLITATAPVHASDDCMIGVPLLRHIYFDSASSRLPDRYVKLSAAEVSTFDRNAIIAGDDYEAYLQILNVIGQRMRLHPSWSITLSPYSFGEAVSDSVLTERVQSVVTYLNRVWSIDTARILRMAHDQTGLRYNPKASSGNRANWRVDIYPSSDSVLAPVWLEHQPCSDSVVLRTAALQWRFDSNDLTPSVQLLFEDLRIRVTDDLSGRYVIHRDQDGKNFSHWWYSDQRRAKRLSDQLAIDSIFVDHDRSRHDTCEHRFPEECIYRSAIYIEYWK